MRRVLPGDFRNLPWPAIVRSRREPLTVLRRLSRMRSVFALLTAGVVLAACSNASSPDPTSSSTSTSTTTSSTSSTSSTTSTTIGGENRFEAARDTLLALASSQGDEIPVGELPLAATVRLGLHNELEIERTPEQLADVESWIVPRSEYAGFSGPFNILDPIRRGRTLNITEGPQPHCAGPPLDPPLGLEDAMLVSGQPKESDSCIDWFSVNLWMQNGEVTAITLELFGP